MPEQQSTYGEDGAYVRVVEYSDDERDDVGLDSVVVRIPPTDDESQLIAVEAFQGDESVYRETFELRDLSFDPISIIGRGETSSVTGISNSDDDVPEGVSTALNGLGMAVVPSGEWWLNE